jgi:hypothetical protein
VKGMGMNNRLLLLILISLFPACGTAKSADRPRAERVFVDQAGYVCFIIRDENGTAVGGNCIKE